MWHYLSLFLYALPVLSTFFAQYIGAQPLRENEFSDSITSRIEVTLSIVEPGSLLHLKQIEPGSAWYVSSPGGILQLFAIGDLAKGDEVHIIVNGSQVLHNVRNFVNSNDGITLTTRQIIVPYPGLLHNQTNVLFYVRDVNLRRSDCGDPVVITNATAEVPVPFSNSASFVSECAVTIISRTEAASDLYTISFMQLNTTSTPELPTAIIAGIYRKWFPEDLILFSITRPHARRWQDLPILERIVTIVVPCGDVVSGFVTAATLPLYSRRVRLGDVGLFSSKNYPNVDSVQEPNVTYTIHTFSPIPFVLHIVKAKIEPLAQLSIITYPPVAVRERINGSVSGQRYRFIAESVTVTYRSPRWDGSQFLIRYHCRGCLWSRVSVPSLVTLALVWLFYL